MRGYGDNKNRHMKSVAEVMYDNAKAVGLNPETAYVVGLLHDVGYIAIDKDTPMFEKISHAKEGARILEGMGISGDNLDAVKFHGVNGYKMIEDGNMKRVSPMLLLLQYADMSVDRKGEKVGFAKRLMDIAERYGNNGVEHQNAVDTVNFIQEMFRFRYEGIKPYICPITEQEWDEKMSAIVEEVQKKKEEKTVFDDKEDDKENDDLEK